MRVTGKSGNVASPQSVGGPKAPSAASPVGATSGPSVVGDALSVSGTAQFIAVTRARIAKIPDIRMAKVEALRSRLEADSYDPDGEAVADGLVKEHTPPRRDP